MSEMTVMSDAEPSVSELLVFAAEAALAAIEAEEAEIGKDFRSRCNGTYSNNKSDEYRDYYRKAVNVLAWDAKTAIVRFAPGEPIRVISRTHLIID